AAVRPQSPVPHPPDDLTQLGTIGLDNEVDRQAVGGPRLGRPDDGHQCSSSSNQACGPLLDVAADDIEHQIDAADVFQRVVVEVDELLRAEVERLLTVGSASGADDVGAGVARELRHHRTDCAGRAVRENALPRLKAAVLEQSLPRGEARDWQARAHREVDVARQRREVACLDGYILRQGAVAMPVGEAEHPLSYRQSRRAVGRSRPIWTAPAGRVHRWARVAHGRTRMIVFPLRRSVRLKAATASSRVETFPMFVRSRPSRTRWMISLSWARSGRTTKSTVKPSAGRASVGPAMVTSVPPARIKRAERIPMSPPMTSKTRSTPPTSARTSL